ncbi:MAG: carbohydrate kinase [Oscillospiraceae bacterium]
MYDIFSVGEVLIDFTPGKEPNSYIRNPGGAPANLAVAASKLGCRCAFCGMVGEDDFGQFLIDALEKEKVDFLCKRRCEKAVTTMAFVTLDEKNDRSFVFARKPGADMMLEATDICREWIERSRLVHAGSCSLSEQPAKDATMWVLKAAHEQKKQVSFDINFRANMWRGPADYVSETVFDALKYVDYLKVSDEEIGILGGEENISRLFEQFGFKIIVVTCAERGSRAYFCGNAVEAMTKSVKAVDTTGAGDAFWGAFLSVLLQKGITETGRLNDEIVLEALRCGNAAGGLAVQSKGAIGSFPTLEQVLCAQKQLLEAHEQVHT